ncbi:hypothetical protein RHOSPDRAFT_31828 [Rhodotorula sp. JG-1b]|nr:hypothetical protein RHOSPDRAFT_31828 [Rhodotorula sp. JG-1b]
MPGENGISPEGVAALPEPAVGVEYPSGEAAKVAVFQAFLAQQAEPACRGNWHKHTIACRLHTDATPSSLGKGSCCTFLYKYESLQLGEDPVKITVANLVHSCPDGVRKARFRSQDLDLGQNYARMKSTKLASQSLSQPRLLPKEPKPSTATLNKDDKLVAADVAESGNPSTSSAPQVDKPGGSASVEPGPSTTALATTATVGVPPPRADPVPPPRATVTPPPPPKPANEAGPSLPAAAAVDAEPAGAPETEHVHHRGSRSSEDPPPYSVQPVTENEPPRKRALDSSDGFCLGRRRRI